MSCLEPNDDGHLPTANLQEQRIDIWYLSTAPPPEQEVLDCLSGTLSMAEREKSQAFKRPQDQLAYRIQRGCLRWVISRYLQQPPASLEFTYGDYGKPFLASNLLQFNVSHSHQRLVIAVSPTLTVGIDIEHHRPLTRFDALCQRCLTSAEMAVMPDLDLDQAQRLFFQYWTCKEAYLKALGLGLTSPMNEVTMPLQPLDLPTRPAPILPITASLAQQGWQIYRWQPEANYSGAVAVHHPVATGVDVPIIMHPTTPTALVQSGGIEFWNT